MSIKPVRPIESPVRAERDHFPTPQTMPDGWDLSGLMELYNQAYIEPAPQEWQPASTPVQVDRNVPADYSV